MPTCIKNRFQNIIRTIIGLLFSTACFGQPINLQPEKDIHSGLNSNFIHAIKTDHLGSIWIGSEKGLDVCGRKSAEIEEIKKTIGSNSVWTIEFTQKHIFVGTRFNGLYIFEKGSPKTFQIFDSTQVGLCRRIRFINDTIYLATNSLPYYFNLQNNKWQIHKIKSAEKEGFYTDFCRFDNKTYVTKYQQLKSFLYQIVKDSLIVSKDIQIHKHNIIPRNGLAITSDKNKMLIGGDGFYQINDLKENIIFNLLRNKEGTKFYPSWDALLLNGEAYIGIGNPDNMQEGMIFTNNQSVIELKNNFYAQTLAHDFKNKGLWIGTANRGIFYWQFPNQSIELRKDEFNDGIYFPSSDNQGLLFNTNKISVIDWSAKKVTPFFKSIQNNHKLHTILDAIQWKDTIACLTGSKVLLFNKQGIKIKDIDYIKTFNRSANKIMRLSGRLILFTYNFDRIIEIEIQSGKSIAKNLNSINAIATPYKTGIIYSSYSTGFHYYDSTSHNFKNSPIGFESYCIQGDTIWTINNGIIRSYKIDLSAYYLKRIAEVNYQKKVGNFYPTWISSAAGKVFIGNSSGYIEISKIDGTPIRFNYIGNFSSVRPPASDGKNLIFNFENYITRFSPDITFQSSSKISLHYEISPKEKIFQNTPFIISFSNTNYLEQKNTLKEILIIKKNKKTDTLYTISDKIEFSNGLQKGDYTIRVKGNGIELKPTEISIKKELLDSPQFYIGLTVLLGLLVSLIFRSILIKKSYEKQILNNRLLLLKQNLNPHFVFNSLNLIYSLVLQNKNDTAIKTIGSFSDLHRYFLDNINQPEIPLSEELKFIESYLQLEALRVENDNKFEFFLPGNLSKNAIQFLVPPMILQPLVENAVKYSTNNNDVRKIWIEIIQKSDKLIIAVENTVSNPQNEKSHGLGLNLVNERIEIYHKTFNKNIKLQSNIQTHYSNSGYRSELIFSFSS